MRRLFQHRGEAEELAVLRLVDDDLLMILVDGGDPNRPGNHHVGLAALVAHFVDALARGEIFEFHLAGQDLGLIGVEQGEQGNVLQHLGVASHQTPRGSFLSVRGRSIPKSKGPFKVRSGESSL